MEKGQCFDGIFFSRINCQPGFDLVPVNHGLLLIFVPLKLFSDAFDLSKVIGFQAVEPVRFFALLIRHVIANNQVFIVHRNTVDLTDLDVSPIRNNGLKLVVQTDNLYRGHRTVNCLNGYQIQ